LLSSFGKPPETTPDAATVIAKGSGKWKIDYQPGGKRILMKARGRFSHESL
jgi:hypothetical protein